MSVETLAYRLGCLFHWPDREVALRNGLKALPASVLKGARLLDVGSGLGQLSRLARECGLDYVGLEPDAGFREEASRVFPGTAFVARGADSIAEEVRSEDLVVLNGVAHHLDDHLLGTVVSAARRGRGLVICDHLRLDGETHAFARFLQDLDRGKFVRKYEDSAPPGFRSPLDQIPSGRTSRHVVVDVFLRHLHDVMSASPSGMILVAPVFNEEKIVSRFLERVFSVAGPADLRGIVIVDDGSDDETCAATRAFLRTAPGPRPKVRLLRLSRNFGHQVAVVAGIQAAVAWAEQAGLGHIGLIDADLQDRPEDLPALLSAASEADVAYGVRARRSEGLLFRLSAATFHWLLARTARFHIPRNAGTFSVMRLRAARVIAAESHQAPYFPALRAWVGFRQVGVPLARDPRADDSSRVGPLGLLRLAMTALLSFSDLPLSFLVVMATITITGSLCAALLMVGLKLAGLVQVQGTALILVSIFLSLGIQSMQLALLAHALGRARAEASRSAGYVVMADEAGL